MSKKKQKLRLDRDIEIIDEHRHELSGARLVLASLKNSRNAERYIVAWVAPWQKSINDPARFESLEDAEFQFSLLKAGTPPVTRDLLRDWQKTKVYEWQYVNIGKGSARLEEPQMKRAVRHISREFNMRAPRVRHERPKVRTPDTYSYYHRPHNKIVMRHKNLDILLHEMAHAIDDKINKNKWADHGPSFVRTLIRLAVRYHWCDAKKLEKSAKESGIDVAPDAVIPATPNPM